MKHFDKQQILRAKRQKERFAMSDLLGAWELAEMKAAPLPEKAATAFSGATSSMVGAKYVPVLYCGEQLVHGVNYMFICEQTLSAQGAPRHLVKMVVNSSEQGSSIVNIERIV